MSYILEALKRADAERERGAVPGLHAHSIALGDIDDGPQRSGTWRWITLGFLIGLAGLVAGWWFASGRGTGVAAVPASATVTATPPAPAAAPADAAPTGTAPAPSPPAPSPTTSAATTPVPARTSAAPKARVAAASAPPVPVAPRNSPPSPARTQAQAPAAPPAPRVPRYSELPDNIRNEIPQLVIGGAMYSDNRANRMLILNGQLLHEGDQPVPGLVLEQIRPKAAVLNFKGQRYEISY